MHEGAKSTIKYDTLSVWQKCRIGDKHYSECSLSQLSLVTSIMQLICKLCGAFRFNTPEEEVAIEAKT